MPRASVLPLVALVGCGSSSEPPPVSVQLDTYNVALAGAGVPAEAERRPRLLAELGKLAGDVACIQEAWQEADKAAIVAATKAAYPHAAWAKTDRSTKIDAPGVAPAPTTAPCAGLEKELDAAAACVAKECSAGDLLTTTACAKDKCLPDVAPLLGATSQACYTCFVANMVSEKLSTLPAVCKAPGLGLGFGGQSSQLLLSKHPLSAVSHLVLPGCWQQRTATRATATLPNGAALDVVCTHLSPVNVDALLPNTCPWAGAETDPQKRWEAEQKVQTDALIAWAKGGKNRLVLLGDLNASRANAAAGIQGYGAPVLAALDAVWVEAPLPTPTCTFCKDNPLVGGVENTTLDHVYLGGIALAKVTSVARTFDAKVDGLAAVHLSDHFGLRVVVTVDP